MRPEVVIGRWDDASRIAYHGRSSIRGPGDALMDRRTLLLCGLAFLLAPVAFSAGGQTMTRPPRVVMILGGSEANARPFTEAFLDGMRQAGQVQGRTVQIDFRFGEFTEVRSLIHKTVAESPAVLVVGGLTAARYARDATTTKVTGPDAPEACTRWCPANPS